MWGSPCGRAVGQRRASSLASRRLRTRASPTACEARPARQPTYSAASQRREAGVLCPPLSATSSACVGRISSCLLGRSFGCERLRRCLSAGASHPTAPHSRGRYRRRRRRFDTAPLPCSSLSRCARPSHSHARPSPASEPRSPKSKPSIVTQEPLACLHDRRSTGEAHLQFLNPLRLPSPPCAPLATPYTPSNAAPPVG